MTISVSIAICTYNGERHLQEQLDSFASQSRAPDEVVISDDGSTDKTLQIAENFAATSPFNVRINRNVSNLGFAHNFEKAASLCTSDIVFFSDQDDVWRNEKIERFVDVFERDPAIGLIFCDADLVDDQLQPLNLTYWQKQGFTRSDQRDLASVTGARSLLQNPAQMAAGATMAFRNRFADSIFPFPDGWTHDAWVATIVGAQSRIAVIPEQLNLYRQHAAQVYGASSTATSRRQHARQRSASRDHFVATSARYDDLTRRLEGRTTLDPRFLFHSRAKVSHWMNRARLRDYPQFIRGLFVARELLQMRYHRYSQGIKSAAMDTIF